MTAHLLPNQQMDIARARGLVDADRQGMAALAAYLGEHRLPDDRGVFYAAAYAAAVIRLQNLLAVTDELLLDGDDVALAVEGAGPLLDPACAGGNCGACPGAPCKHLCHGGGAP